MEIIKIFFTKTLNFYFIFVIFLLRLEKMRYEESKILFDKASEMLKCGDIVSAFDTYCDAFLSRISENVPSLDFYFFYRSQLLKYLKEKKSLKISLSEGDMISDLIYSYYLEFLESIKTNPFVLESIKTNPFVKNAKGRFRLLMSVKIIFPDQNDTCLDDFPKIVSK